MKVAFNGTALLGPLTGIGQYAWQLATRLQKAPGVDLALFYGGGFDRQVRSGGTSVSVSRLRQLARDLVPKAYELARWRRQWYFDRGVRGQGFDVYHEPNFLAYRFDGPLVLTVHDLSWIRYPETHPPERVRAMHRYFEPSLRAASVVLTVSEFVKQEVIEVFGTPGERIRAIPNGLDPLFVPLSPQQTRAALDPLGLVHGAYFLSVGTLEPRKNLETTLAAYASLPATLRQRIPLVIAGMKGWRTTRIEQLLAPLESSGQARVLGYLERSQLAAVTAGALAMVYPSLYEGFGLPALEAMGCGVPAVASTASSLPEVVGDTGLLADPMDTAGVAAAMQRLAEDQALRDRLGRAALARAAAFTWDRCVADTLQAYRDAAASTSR